MGTTGTPGESVMTTVESPGANCVNGGVKLSSASGVTYVCNGAAGSAGTDGASVVAVSLGPGDPNCPNGGSAFTIGTQTTYACNGTPAPTYSAGAGLALSGTQFSAAFTPSGGDNGTGTTVARGDHLHDARYVSRSAVYKNGAAAPVPYDVTLSRYIVDAPPSSVGVVVPLDSAIVDSLCRDLDGCSVSLAMVNWDQPGQPGNVSHIDTRLWLSSTSRWWRFSSSAGDAAGTDAAGGVQEISAWDCYFGDSETYTGTPNGRADVAVGWGLLNCAGCNYSDATVTCRVVIDD